MTTQTNPIPAQLFQPGNLRSAVREIEAHVKTLAHDKETQIKILSVAQGLETARKNRTDEYNLTVLSLAKSRIIRN